MKINSLECTKLKAKLIFDSESASLKSLVPALLGKEMRTYQEALQSGKDDFEQYAMEDAIGAYELDDLLDTYIDELNLKQLCKIETDFAIVDLECQINGIRVDRTLLNRELKQTKKRKSIICDYLNAFVEGTFNPNSPKQILRLFNRRGIPIIVRRGKMKTDKDSLQKVSQFKEVKLLLDYKEQESWLRYLKTVDKFTDTNTSRIHPYTNTLGASTGRATSAKPNMQNCPSFDEARELFIASDEHLLICKDFSQIEPRVLAHFIPESNFAKLFQCDEDFYVALGKKILGEENKQSRKTAKTLMLAVSYGLSDIGLSEQLGISKQEAAMVRTHMYSLFPEIAEFKAVVVEKARRRGYAEGLLNRRRTIQNINSPDNRLRFEAERQAFNAVIQGSATTIFKYKVTDLARRMPEALRFLMHVHDEILMEAPITIAEQYSGEIHKILEEPIPWFSQPLKVKGGVGENWASIKGAS